MSNIPELVTLNVNIRNRQYTAKVSNKTIEIINRIARGPESVIKSQTRGKEISSYIASNVSFLTAIFLENIEPETLDWIDTMPADSVFYDLGASTGPFSVYAALSKLHVIAFEPEAQNFSLLEMNHFLNKNNIKHPIISFNVAISDRYELGKMYCADYKKGAHEKILDTPEHVLGKNKFTPQHTQSVIKYPLDQIISDFSLPPPQYLKIDVDGAEGTVIGGADKTLKNEDLREIFIELTNSDEAKELAKKIESYGFNLVSRYQVENYENLFNCIYSRRKN